MRTQQGGIEHERGPGNGLNRELSLRVAGGRNECGHVPAFGGPSTSSLLKAAAIPGRTPRAALRAYAQGERFDERSPRPSHHAIAAPASSQPISCSAKAASVKSSGKRYQFQYGSMLLSQANTAAAAAIATRRRKPTTASPMTKASASDASVSDAHCRPICGPICIMSVPRGWYTTQAYGERTALIE